MHIHGAIQSFQDASIVSNASRDASAATQRAAEVRKRLLKNAQTTGADSTPEETVETVMIGQWFDSRHSRVLSGDEYHAAAEGKDPDLG